MLIVINGNNYEPLLESNYEKHEELNGASLQISFDAYNFPQNNKSFPILDANVTIEDEDGNMYIVKQLTNTVDSKRVVANHIYYENIGFRINDSLTGNRSFNEYANFIFNNSGWTFRNIDVNYSRNFNNFGNNNLVALVERLTINFDCEMKILPNRIIEFKTRIGNVTDKQYRYGVNIGSISESIDTTNVRTAITATGANGLTTTYLSPLASNSLFGFKEAEPISDDSISNLNELREFARRNLRDTLETNIETTVVSTDGEIGDTVFVIHEKLNLEFETRIISKTTRRDYEQSTIQLGNTVIRTIEDAIIDQKKEVQENKEQTDAELERIEEETQEELATINVGLNDISLDVRNTENTLRSEIVQTANSIRLQVEEVDRSVASLEITADRIQSNVTNLENNTNSSITQLSNNINLKVDVGGTISDINLSQGSATINADRINLNGAVVVNGNISGATDINVNQNISIGNALYFGGSQGSVDFIEISGGDMTFNSFGDFMFSGGRMYLNGYRVLTEQDLP